MSLTTDPKDPRLGHGSDDAPKPQNEVYLVLSEAQRAKGFVRPYRDSYRHVGQVVCGKPRLGHSQDEDGRTWVCVWLRDHPGDCGAWTTEESLAARKGCGSVTTMGRALSETYAREPSFYGSTYCVACAMHRPVAEFVWDVDGAVVGS